MMNTNLPMSDKSPAIRNFIEGMFPGTTKRIADGECPTCGQPIGQFRDALSAKEFRISGMCQGCQDAVFDVE